MKNDEVDDIIVGLNVHNAGRKVPIARHEKPSDDIWKKWLENNEITQKMSETNYLLM